MSVRHALIATGMLLLSSPLVAQTLAQSEAPPPPAAPAAPAPSVITIGPQTGFGLPGTAAQPGNATPGTPPIEVADPFSLSFDEAFAQRRARQQQEGRIEPATPPRQPASQRQNCEERADGVRCVYTSGTSPEARARAEALARGVLDRLEDDPP